MISMVLKSGKANRYRLTRDGFHSPAAEEMLYVKDLQVNEGPRMKRVWPRARGRRDILLKRMSHIYVVVDEIARMGE